MRTDLKISLALSILFVLSCKSSEVLIQNECLQQELIYLIDEDNLSGLYAAEKLCAVVNVQGREVYIAILNRANVSDYMSMYTPITPKGYFIENNTLVLVYGDNVKGLDLKNDISIWESVYRKKELKTGGTYIPPPPKNIEPIVHQYAVKGKCIEKVEEGTHLRLIQ